jgi:hypothetical protein
MFTDGTIGSDLEPAAKPLRKPAAVKLAIYIREFFHRKATNPGAIKDELLCVFQPAAVDRHFDG